MSSLTSALEIGLIGVVSAASVLLATTPSTKPHPVNEDSEQVESGLQANLPSTTTQSSYSPPADQHHQDTSSAPANEPKVDQRRSSSPERTQSLSFSPKPAEPIVEKKDPCSDFLSSLGSPIAPEPTTSRVTHSLTSPTNYTPISIPQQQAPPFTQSDLVLPPPSNTLRSPEEEFVDPDNLVPTTLPDSTASSVSSLSDEADSQASIRSIPPTPGPDAFNSAPPTPFSPNEDEEPERHQLTAVPTTLSRISSHASSNMSAPPLATAPQEATPDHSRVAIQGQSTGSTRSLSPEPQPTARPTSPSVEQREREQQEMMDRERNEHQTPVVAAAAVPAVYAVEENSEPTKKEQLYAAPAQNGGLRRDVSMTRGFMPVPTSSAVQPNNFVAAPPQQNVINEDVSHSALDPNDTPYTAPVVNELATHDGQHQSDYQPRGGMSFEDQRVPVESQHQDHTPVVPVIQTDNFASPTHNNYAATTSPSPVTPATNNYNQSVVSPSSHETRGPSFSENRDASTAGAQANPKDLAKITKSEHKRAKSISKILKQEGKDETKQLEMAIKELARLQKNQRDSVHSESKAAKVQQEALKVERKAHERFLKEKAAYDKVLAHLHTRDEELKAHQDTTLRHSQILGEQTAKVEQLRNAKAVDDRMRAEKLAELRK